MPVFDTVTLCAPLAEPTVVEPKVSAVGLADSDADPLATPVPDSATEAVPFVALLLIVNDPVREPVAVGWNVTVTVQFAPAAIDVPQVFVCV